MPAFHQFVCYENCPSTPSTPCQAGKTPNVVEVRLAEVALLRADLSGDPYGRRLLPVVPVKGEIVLRGGFLVVVWAMPNSWKYLREALRQVE